MIEEKTMKFSFWKILRHAIDVFCESRFVTCGCISVKNALIHRLVDQGNRRKQKLRARRLVMSCNRRTQLFYRRTKLALIAAVDISTLCVLTDSFFC